ncbi:MAG: hypothetical protein LJD31_02410 [Wolbachia endosymbiont of Menacanthus eurysternus]|nr:hypothetical protein [Wolbachia endosymbiont of Menacanthus eurysternus]
MFDSSHSQEKVIVQGVFQDKNEFDNNPEIQAVLDVINKDKKANLFSEVAKYYRDNKNIFLFVAMLRNKEQLEKILNVISEGCGVHAKERFIVGMNVFLDGINTGERNAREFLSAELSHSDLVAFFNGPQAAHQDQVRNIYRNLNINAIKLGQALEHVFKLINVIICEA